MLLRFHGDDAKVHRTKASIELESGRPVIVLESGKIVDKRDWMTNGYAMVSGTREERQILYEMGLPY